MDAVRVFWQLVALAACLVVLAVPNAFAGKRVALAIGNSAYQHSTALQNPKHDAADIAAALRGLGFRVIEEHDVTKAAMDAAIRNFAVALADANVGVFFYAGHGLQVSGENYLVPIDAKLESPAALEFEMVRFQTVQRVMERATATNFLFLDACRDNPLARNLARALGTRSASIGRGLAPAESGAGTLVSFSTQPGNVALDGTGRNSPFANALVQHLASSREDLSTILINVRNDVMAETGNRQVPWEHSALRARFYLHDTPPADTATAGPQPPLSETAQAWAVTKDSKSPAVLRAFSDRYPGTVYAELARARLKEMEEDATQRLASPHPGPSLGPFDGIWRATWKGDRCPLKGGEWELTVQGTVVRHPSGAVGFVNASGELTIDLPARADTTVKVRHTIRLAAHSGTGTFQTLGHACAGTTVLKRISGSTAAKASK